MQYLISVFERSDDDQAWKGCGPLGPDAEAYLRDVILPVLRPLSDDEYVNGPARILSTFAKYVYVLDGETVLWCIEWDPGLLVIRFSPDGAMEWAAARRLACDEEEDVPDELDENGEYEEEEDPQYDLIFDAWDAQFDNEWREGEWRPATEAQLAVFEAALAHVNELQETLRRRCENDPQWERAWREQCEQSPIWRGDIAMA